MAKPEIRFALTPQDIEWEMDWSGRKEDGSRTWPDKPEKEMVFETEGALAHLLLNEVICLNSHWWEKEWPEAARKRTSLNVNCNDVFAWGCADAESIDFDEIETLYRMWTKDPSWGPAVWCLIKRNEMPQKPVEDRIRAGGIWDLDALGLGKNVTDEQCQAMFALVSQKLLAERDSGSRAKP